MSDNLENRGLFPALLNDLYKLNIPVINENEKTYKDSGVFAKIYLSMDEELIRRTNVRTKRRLSGPVIEFFCKNTGELVNAYHLSRIFEIPDDMISQMVRYSLRISSIFDNLCSKQNIIPEFVKIAFYMDDQDIKIFIVETNYGIKKKSGSGY